MGIFRSDLSTMLYEVSCEISSSKRSHLITYPGINSGVHISIFETNAYEVVYSVKVKQSWIILNYLQFVHHSCGTTWYCFFTITSNTIMPRSYWGLRVNVPSRCATCASLTGRRSRVYCIYWRFLRIRHTSCFLQDIFHRFTLKTEVVQLIQ
jgi:hypothetical protein